MLTRRERLRRCFFHEELDRPAVYSRTGFPHEDPSYDRLKAYLAEKSELKGSWAWENACPPPPTESFTEHYSDDFARRVTILHTPAGDLRATRLVSLTGQPGLNESSFVQSREDAEKYLSLPMPVFGGDVGAFSKADEEIEDRGVIVTSLGMNPAGTVAELCGSENFAIMSVTDRDILDALCERHMNIAVEKAKCLLARNVGPYFGMLGEEFVVPPLHGPRDFYDFNVKYDKPVMDLIHEAGGRVHIHCHGSIKKVFQGFIDMRADVLHPFEAPPSGDITAREAKELARGKMCLEGNVQIADMYDRTPEEIRTQVEVLIADTFDDHSGLIVCPSASPYIRGRGEECFPQYKAMIDAVLEWSE